MKTPQKINIPQGMKLEQKNGEWYFVPIEEVLTSAEKLIRCQKMIEEFNNEKKLFYFLNIYGRIVQGVATWNSASENLIKAELIQMVWRRLALKLNKEVLDFNDSSQNKYFAYLDDKKIIKSSHATIDVGVVYFTSEAYDEALELIGEENLIFMFNNLNK